MADTRAREQPMYIRGRERGGCRFADRNTGGKEKNFLTRGRAERLHRRCSVARLSDRGVLTHTGLTVARVHKQRQVRVQKREQRVKRRNARGTASTHHAACSRPLHKRPCRLAARANERFYNSMQSPPEGPFKLSFSPFLSPVFSAAFLSLQLLALLRTSLVSLPCERTSPSGICTRAYHYLLSSPFFLRQTDAHLYSREKDQLIRVS